MDNPHYEANGQLADVTRLAVKLGFTAFGGPAAHIAMLRQEVVDRRRWLTEQHYLDLIGVTNLIPGPNSTEMVIHVGYERAGWRGLIAAGVGFIVPAASLTLCFAWLYVRYGTTPRGEHLLYGIKPVIIAVVAQALWNLGRLAVSTVSAAIVGAFVIALYLLGLNEILLLFGGGVLAVALRGAARVIRRDGGGAFAVAPVGAWSAAGLVATVADSAVSYSVLRLFLTFLKIGSVLYGSGYVLLAFLRNDFVERYGWLTEEQLLDAVAVGQMTPGPVFSTATFVGYVVGGFWGAVVATVGIFLPAFVFVAALNPLVKRIRQSPSLSALLDGINAAALGLMAGVGWTLGRAAVIDLPTAVLAATAALLLIRFKVNSAWLVVAGGAFGLLFKHVT